MDNSLKGVLYIAIGASSYGVLATFVKYANNNGLGTAGLTFSQYLFGFLVLSLISLFFSKKPKDPIKKKMISEYPKLKLILFGTTLGLTSSFYYLSIQYVPVSVGIILLMQTIWMGVVLEFLIAPALVHRAKVIGAVIAIFGTVLAAKVFETDIAVNFKGIAFGLLAALSYTGAMYASNKVSLELPLITRSKYLVGGGLLTVILFWNVQILEEFNSLSEIYYAPTLASKCYFSFPPYASRTCSEVVDWVVFLKWGAFLGFFGTILPPILFNKGLPEIGTGLGSIIAAIEIPVSVFSAYLLLHEEISVLQWAGVVIILFSVVIINLKKIKLKKMLNFNRTKR